MTVQHSQPVMARLKAATDPYHKRLEAMPFFTRLSGRQLPLQSYIGQLITLATVHGAMEKALAATVEKRVSAVWHDGLRKLPLLEGDLSFFASRDLSMAAPAAEAAAAMAAKIRVRQMTAPVSLLGYLYAFEGSTLGNRMHRADVAETFSLHDAGGLRYYTSYGDSVARQWQAFGEAMNRALFDRPIQDRVIAAACEAFEGLESLYGRLFPVTDAVVHVASINPEAGDHPIPEDPREIAAALRASGRAWAQFPYYEMRYGSRGKRFSDSDTCWLATLIHLDVEAVKKQVEWLAGVLAARGMPSIMLEKSLRYLHEELAEAVPERRSVYAKLLMAADQLAEKRAAQIPPAEFQALCRDFRHRVGAEFAERCRRMDQLLACAAADEKCGMQGAAEAFLKWMREDGRFSENWLNAAERIISAAGLPKQAPDAGR